MWLTLRPLPWWRRFLGLFVALTWLIGLGLGLGLERPWSAWAAWVVAGALLGLLVPAFPKTRQSVVAPLALFFVVAGLAGWRADAVHLPQPEATLLGDLATQKAEVRLVGWVRQPLVRSSGRVVTVVEVEAVHTPPLAPARPVTGRVWVVWYPDRAPALHYGDRVTLRGRLQPLPTEGRNGYRDVLLRRGIFAEMVNPRVGVLGLRPASLLLRGLFALREHAYQVVQTLWPEPEAGFFAGVLLGMDNALAETVYRAFRETGTAHILVISGFNITIVAGLFLALFRRVFSQGRAMLAAAIAVLAYALLVGADSAVLRAAVMALLSLWAHHLGRRSHGLTALAFTAAIMAGVQPLLLWDVSFQLSFAATLGLLLFGDPLVEGFTRLAARCLPRPWPQRLAGPAGEFFLMTLAAQTTTLPVMVVHFGQLSLISWVANPLILPVQAPLMVLGGLAVLVGLVALPLARVSALLAWPLAAYSIRLAEVLARFPWATVPVRADVFLVLYAFFLVMLWVPALHRAGRRGIARVPRWGWVLGLWALNVVLWNRVVRLPEPPILHLWVWPAGNGLVVLMQTPGGAYLLLNAGEDGQALQTTLGRLLPWPGGRVPWWVVASGHTENVAGYLDLMETHLPDHVLWVPTAVGPPVLRRLRQGLDARAVPRHLSPAGTTLAFAAEGRLTVEDVRPLGGALHLTYAALDLWLTPFAEPDKGPWTLVLSGLRGSSTVEAGLYRNGHLFLPVTGLLHLQSDGEQLWLTAELP